MAMMSAFHGGSLRGPGRILWQQALEANPDLLISYSDVMMPAS